MHQEFLKHLPGSVIFLQHQKGYFEKKSYAPDGVSQDYLEEMQKRGYSPFYTVNAFNTDAKDIEKAHKLYKENRGAIALPKTVRFKENLKCLNACYLDLDIKKEGEEVDIKEAKRTMIKKLERCGIPPHMIIVSKNGLQALWLLENGTELANDPESVKRYTDVEKGLIEWSKEVLGSLGDKVKDVARVLRLPGYFHLKNPKDPYKVFYKHYEHSSYYLNNLYDIVKGFIPDDTPVHSVNFKSIQFEAYDSFDLAEEVNAHIDIEEATRVAFKAVGVGFEVDRDGYRWWVDGRLTGTFFGKEGKNIACTTSSADPYSGPPFAVVCQIFDRNGSSGKEAAKFMNETWGVKLRGAIKKTNRLESIDTSAPRLGITKDDLVDDLFARRYANYYSWIVPEIDKQGGLLTLGRMAIIGGPHGSGKSTYTTEVAKHNAKTKKTMMIPLEMGADFTVMTLVCNLFNSKKPISMEYMGYGEAEEGYLYKRPEKDQELFRQCAKDLYENYSNLYIQNPKSLEFEDLKAMIEKYATAEGIKFFIVDHLHQLNSSMMDSETQFYSMVAKDLKELAARLDIALLCVVQLTKAANSIANTLDLASFKGTSEFTSNAHRVVVIKKASFKPMGPREASSWLAREGLKDDMSVEDVIENYEDDFNEKTRNIRELVFLKTRGRDGGTVTMKMEKGAFTFLNYGSYKFHNDKK